MGLSFDPVKMSRETLFAVARLLGPENRIAEGPFILIEFAFSDSLSDKLLAFETVLNSLQVGHFKATRPSKLKFRLLWTATSPA